MSSEPEHPLSVEERRRVYGTVVGKKPFASGPPPEVGMVYELRFTGEHLDRLMEGIRDFGIFPADEFFLGAVMAAIDKREAELGGEKVVNPERERKIAETLERQAQWRRELRQRRQDEAVRSAD